MHYHLHQRRANAAGDSAILGRDTIRQLSYRPLSPQSPTLPWHVWAELRRYRRRRPAINSREVEAEGKADEAAKWREGGCGVERAS